MIFHPQAQREIRTAIEFYRVRDLSVAVFFAAELNHCFKSIQHNPLAYPVFTGKIRKLPMRRFPFNVLYSMQKKEPYIVAVMHQKREPFFWKDRI